MRKYLHWLAWAILFVLPVAYAFEIWWIQNLPKVELWQWSILFAAVVLLYFSRDRDEVMKHHVV